ncbi:hypothetical protein ACO2RV_01400 [Ancylobacter sp. VNQ12]|uniref:hypothetical protein n=1 Tax=Ancylobacter sp. VNQ12 TaxID=3400920 RepID=UPI003BFD65EA
MAEVSPVSRTVARWGLVVGLAVLLAAAIGLWARHGAAVFFDMVAAGFAYCF